MVATSTQPSPVVNGVFVPSFIVQNRVSPPCIGNGQRLGLVEQSNLDSAVTDIFVTFVGIISVILTSVIPGGFVPDIGRFLT